jgi:hypothetical protein
VLDFERTRSRTVVDMTLTDPPTTAADLDDATLSIAAAAERSGVSAHTLRYYEQLGLVTPERDENDRRR